MSINAPEDHVESANQVVQTLDGIVTGLNNSAGFIMDDAENTYIFPLFEYKQDINPDGSRGEGFSLIPIAHIPNAGDLVKFNVERRPKNRTGMRDINMDELVPQLQEASLCWGVEILVAQTYDAVFALVPPESQT